MGGFDASRILMPYYLKIVSIPERVWGVLMQKVMRIAPPLIAGFNP